MAFSDYYSGVQHIGIPTKDLATAESFWTKLGFKKTGDFPVGDVIFMQRDNLVIETWHADEVAGKPGKRCFSTAILRWPFFLDIFRENYYVKILA